MSKRRRRGKNKTRSDIPRPVRDVSIERSGKKLHLLLIYLVLALSTFVAFEQVRLNEFVSYDDGEYVTENRNVNGGISRQSVAWAFSTVYAGNWHPLTWLSHMLDCELFGLKGYWHHLTSLLFHIVNTLLLFWVLQRMTGAVWASGFVAAAFALHPLHVESVAWVAERKDVLSAFFWMLTMAAYMRYTERPGAGRYVLVFLVFGLGLMAKPMLVTLPFVLLLLDYWPLGRFQKGRASRLIIEKIPLLALAVLSSVVTFAAQQKGGTMAEVEILPLHFRIANGVVSYVSYICKMIYPAGLAVLYPHPGGSLPAWQVVVSTVVLIGITAVVIYLARRGRAYPAAGWLWYLGTLVPVIGLVQVGLQATADRYTYLPSIGIFIMAAWGASEFLARWRFRGLVLGMLGGLVLAALLVCTRIQVRYWREDAVLFKRALSVTKDNFLMHNNYGRALLEKGRLDEAVVEFRRTLALKPGYCRAHSNLGITLARQNKFDEAIASLSRSLEIDPEYAKAHSNMGMVLTLQGKIDKALGYFHQALQLKPDYADAHYNLGHALALRGNLEEAVVHYRQALQIKPDDADAYNSLGQVLQSQGRIDEAIEHFHQALQGKGDFADVHNNLGVVMASQGKLDEAIGHYRRALQYEGNFAEVHNNLANALLAQGKLDEAVTHLHKLAQLKPDSVEAYINIGIIFASQGKLDEAIRSFRRALQLNPDYADAHCNLGLALQLQGKFAKAIEQYRRALEINPNYTEAREFLSAAIAEQQKR